MSKMKSWFQGPQSIGSAESADEYAVERVPKTYRWPIPAIILVMQGNSTAMFWFIIGASLAYAVGWPGMLAPMAYLLLGSVVIGSLVMRLASREGLSLGLLTRGLGFGYMGSAVTSLIYAINFIFYFVFEGSIVSHSIAYSAGIETGSLAGIGIFAAIGLLSLGFVWRGMASLQFLQTWGVPIFLALFGFGLYQLFSNFDVVIPEQWRPQGESNPAAMWVAMNLVNGLVVFEALMATDYGRFAKPDVSHKGTAAIMVGTLLPAMPVVLCGALFGYTLLPYITEGDPLALSADPGYVFATVMGGMGVLFAVITQIRINVLNLYSGSIAIANTVDMVFDYRSGRGLWLVTIWVLGVLLYAFDALSHAAFFLAVTGILTNAWVLIILADYFVCRKLLKLETCSEIEFRKEFLRPWNPCGVCGMGAAVLIGALGVIEVYPVYYSSFIAMAVAPLVHVTLSIASNGKYYRPAAPLQVSDTLLVRKAAHSA